MATIRKRGPKYQVIIRRTGFASISKTFHKRSDAQEWSRFMEAKADRGDLPASNAELSAYTLKDILLRYRDEVSTKKRGYEVEKYLLDAFMRRPIASLNMKELNSSHFSAYRQKRLKDVQPVTVNRELTIIQHALNTASLDWGIPLKENPLNKLKKLKVQNARDRRLEDGEEELILQEAGKCQNPYIRPIIQLALETAMRRGEILNIQAGDVDLAKRTLHIPVTKNGHARTIPLTQKAIEIIEDLSTKQGELFPTTANAFRLSWVRLIKRTSIENPPHFHDCRHEAISRFFELGLSVPEVALISGHRDYRMLARYTHMRAEEVAEKLTQAA